MRVAAEFIKKRVLMKRKRKCILRGGMMPERSVTDDSAEGLTTTVKGQRAEYCHLRGKPAKESRLLLVLKQLPVSQS